MRKHIIERVFESAFYLVSNQSTIRETAKVVGVSKSTTHKDLQDRLASIDPVLHAQVYEVLSVNLAERHLRGGEATREAYLNNTIGR